jgi:Secretion system C-terminal sorting domain
MKRPLTYPTIARLTLTLAIVLTMWQVQAQTEAPSVTCGLSPDFIKSCGRKGSATIHGAEGSVSYTPVSISDFPDSAVYTCGKFRVYYADFFYSPLGGFADASEGSTRRSTLCDVLSYIQSVIDFSAVSDSTPIRLYVAPSYDAAHPLPKHTYWYAQGLSFFDTSGTGIVNGYVNEYVTSGTDPISASQAHALLRVNFSDTAWTKPSSWSTYTFSFHDSDGSAPKNCEIDLYTTLLHQMGHILGKFSLVQFDTIIAPVFNGHTPKYMVNPNLFTACDSATRVSTNLSSLAPLLITMGGVYPSLDTSQKQNNNYWVNNQSAPDNYPLYSGILQYSLTYFPYMYLQDFDDQPYAYSLRERMSPGKRENYVMSPFSVEGDERRTFSKAEIQTFRRTLGYHLTSAYLSGYELSSTVADSAVLANHNPYSATMASYPSFTFPNYSIYYYAELISPLDTLVNDSGVYDTITVSRLGLTDADGDAIYFDTTSVVNIRGCGNGGNNHAQLRILDKQTIVYKPRPNFYGWAQFGVSTTDGKESGSYVIVTMDVRKGTNVVCPTGSNIILNGNDEEGSEVAIWGSGEQIPNYVQHKATAQNVSIHEGMLGGGLQLADCQPYCFLSNSNQSQAGTVIRDSWIPCGQGQTIDYSTGSSYTSFSDTSALTATSLPIPSSGNRYTYMQSPEYNYYLLGNNMQSCHKYVLEYDVYRTAGSGSDYFSIGFMSDSNIHTSYFATTGSFSPAFSVTTVDSESVTNTWQHKTYSFWYCGQPTNLMGIKSHLNKVCLDNVSLRVDTTATVPTMTVSVSRTATGCSNHLTAVAADTTCKVYYTWRPATGLSDSTGASVVATTASATTYTVTASEGCQTATDTFTVPSVLSVYTPRDSVCSGSITRLVAAGGDSSYTWSASGGSYTSTGSTLVSTPSVTTTYSVTACGITATITIHVDTVPVIHVAGSGAVCSGSATSLSATGASTYTWTSGSSLSCTACAATVATPTATTTYYVHGTDGHGCTGVGSATVTTLPAATISAGGPVSLCAGAAHTLTASGGTGYTWSPGTGLSCTSCGRVVISPSTTTTYTVTGTDSAGCTGSATVVATIAGPHLTTPSSISVCDGSSASLTTSGASSYSWTGTGLSCTTCASPTVTPTATATYTVTGTDSSGCTATTTTTVTVHPAPTIAVDAPSHVCSGTATTLTASGTAVTYSWSPGSALSCTTCSSTVATPTTTTTYTLTASDSACTVTTTVPVVVDRHDITTGGPISLCHGGSGTIAAFGCVTYSWSPSAGLSCTTCSSPVATPTTTTTYTVTGTDTVGCPSEATVTAAVHDITIATTSSVSVCEGSSATISASGAATYSWSGGTISCTTCSSPTVSPTVATVYTVTGTDAYGCVGTGTTSVTIKPVPTVSASGRALICSGASATLSASGTAASYSWSPSSTLSCSTCTSPVASPTATTVYTLTGTDTNGCARHDTTSVTIDVPAISAGGPVSLCHGGSTSLTASGGVSYSWSPSTGLSCTACSTTVATVSGTVTYTVVGTDTHGCSKSATVTARIDTPHITATGSATLCAGTSATLTGSGAAHYTWSGSSISCTTCASPTVSPTTTTTYTVTGTDSHGCTATAMVPVTVHPSPSVSAGSPVTLCSGASTTLAASGTATGYSWSPATSLSCSTCLHPVATPTATTVFTLTGTDSSGCSRSASVSVGIDVPAVSAGGPVSLCHGGSTSLSATGASAYAWYPATGLSCTACATPTLTASATTTYTVTGTDSLGCTKSDTVVASVDVPSVSATSATICGSGSARLFASGGATYAWSGAGLSCTSCAAPTATTTITTTYTVTATDSAGCSGVAVATVTVGTAPALSVSGVSTICHGSSGTISASGASGYSWSPSTGLSCATCSSPVCTATTSTTYTLTGTDSGGCSATTTFPVHVHTVPLLTATGSLICHGATTTLSASGAATYSWVPSRGLSCTACDSPVASPTVTTTYTVTGTDSSGCATTDTVTTTVDVPTVTMRPRDTVFYLYTDTLRASGATSYTWSPATGLSCTACATPVLTAMETTEYTVTATDAHRCSTHATKVIIVENSGVHGSTGVSSVTGNNDIAIYPNPASSELYIKYAERADGDQIAIYDIAGRTIRKEHLSFNGNLAKVSTSDLASGVYVLEIFNDSNVKMTRKIVVQQ